MRRFAILLGIGSLLILPALMQPVQAQTQTLITADEMGTGTLNGIAMPGVILNDNQLFYSMLNPPSLLPGYVLLLEGTAGPLSDVIQFGGFGAVGTAPQLGFLFFSDNSDGIDEPADRAGLPTIPTDALTATILEGQLYTPTANQPGFVAGFSVTYNFISDLETVPDAGATAGLLGLGLASLLALARRTRC